MLDLNDRTTIGGSQGASSSSGTYYNENDSSVGSYPVAISSGSIASSSGSQGLIGTADSTSGTVYSHGDVSGAVVAGANEQGAIATSVVQPGYVHAHPGSPGYVLMNGVKTTYGNYNSKGTFTHGIGDQGVVIAGPPAPGVVLTGHPGAETYLTGQPAPGVIVGGAPGSPMTGSAGEYYNIGGPGSPIYDGSAGHRPQYYPSNLQPSSFPQNPIITVNTDNGYKTNEYHDNGGRGTIRYNNGEITHKYTEDDVREHQSKFGTPPKFDVTTYETDSADFTKTGPTKTGIVMAQVGGSATYVSGTSTPKPSINPQNIGAHAFSSNSGYSDTSSKISNGAAKPIPTSPPSVKYTTSRTNYESGRIDGSKINLGSYESNSKQSTSGYTYDKPANQFKNFGIPSTTRAPQSVIKQEIYSSSPAPYLNVRVYNNPSLVTDSPIGYTTGLKENFKTTVFEAAKVPIGTSTVQPVYDTGYKTVISSTQYPINVNSNNFGYSKNTGYRTNSVSTKDNSGLDINVSFQPHLSTQEQYETIAPAGGIESTGYDKPRRPAVTQSVINYQQGANSAQGNYGSTSFSDYSGTNVYRNSTYTQNAGSFGQKIGSVTSRPVYQSPVVTPSSQVYDAPTSTLASVASVTYRPPFKIVSPQPTPRVPSEGYNYARPSAKFGSTPSSTPKYQNPIIIETESNTKNLGGSRTRVDTASRTEGGKLVTNYNRGSTRFTPNAYDPYMDTRRGETSVNANQKSYSSNSGQSYSSDVISANDKTVSGYSSIYSTTPDYRTKTQSRDYNRGRISGSEYYRHNEENSDSSSNIASGVSTTYRPISKSSTPGPFRKQSSLQVSYGSTTPAVTTYSGSYGRGSSTAVYKATTPKPLNSKKGRGKVVVKFSDLHPLLLGKLGAECTCKADPFASFRSGKPLPIESSRGRVDLSNYDESEVYVDLESSKENDDYDDGEYRTPAIADYDSATPSSKNSRIKSQRPSSTYLPGSPSTYLPPVSPTQKSSYSSRFSAASKSSRGSSRASMPFSDDSIKALFTSDQRQGGFRAAKSLGGSETSSRNALASKVATSDRSGPGALRGSDDNLEGANNCARPGLFRHPNYCNKFYVCHWDEWKKKFTLHVFDCPVHLTFDNEASACNWPSKGPACQDDNLLV